jgi:hypothetical protein
MEKEVSSKLFALLISNFPRTKCAVGSDSPPSMKSEIVSFGF